MVNNGYVGEYDDPISGRTIVIKNHGFGKLEYADGIILVVRNPYDAIIASFNKRMSGSHTGSVGANKFSGKSWKSFVKQRSERWARDHNNTGKTDNRSPGLPTGPVACNITISVLLQFL